MQRSSNNSGGDGFAAAADRAVSATPWGGIRIRSRRLLAAARAAGRRDGAATDVDSQPTGTTVQRILATFDAQVAGPVGAAVRSAVGRVQRKLAAQTARVRLGAAGLPGWLRGVVMAMLVAVEAAGGYMAFSLLWGLPDWATWPVLILIAVTLALAGAGIGAVMVGDGDGRRARVTAAVLTGVTLLGFAASVAAYRAGELRYNAALQAQTDAEGRGAAAARAAAQAVQDAKPLVDIATVAVIATVLALGLAAAVLVETMIHADGNRMLLRLNRRTQQQRLTWTGRIQQSIAKIAALIGIGYSVMDLRAAVHAEYWAGYRETCDVSLADELTTTGTDQYPAPPPYPWLTGLEQMHHDLADQAQQLPAPALPLHPDTPVDLAATPAPAPTPAPR